MDETDKIKQKNVQNLIKQYRWNESFFSVQSRFFPY